MILSVSSSKASSNCLISFSTSGTVFICSLILSSLSRSLIAKNLCCSFAISKAIFSSTFSIASSTFLSNLCTISWLGFLASSTALLAASLIPLPLRAEISTTSQPKLSFKSLMLILSPDFSMISIMLTAITTGIPNSISCVDK